MKISTKGKYALVVMTYIAMNEKDSNVSVAEISEKNNISEKYLEQILSLLSKGDLVTSFRGNAGGYRLSRDAQLITLKDIMLATEGNMKSVSCLDGDFVCDKASQCVTVSVWAKLDDIVNNFFEQTTLQDIIDKKV